MLDCLMVTYVYDFAHGNKDEKDLLGGKGANLAEMTNLGLPVPPGFTISTVACRAYLERAASPTASPTRSPRTSSRSRRRWAAASARPATRCWCRVRSGAAASMPGMMETVLNVGLNDESVQGLASSSDNPRFAHDSYRRLLHMFGGTVLGIEGELFRDALDDLKKDRGTTADTDLGRRGPPGAGRDLQGDHREGSRPALPAGAARAARPRRTRRLRLVEHRPRGALPPPGADPRGPRHRRQHPGDGLRQLRRRLRLRRLLHP